MHQDDSGVVGKGNTFWNTKGGNALQRIVTNVFLRTRRFTPGLTVDDGYDLSGYGSDARIAHIPGHSMGSIGVLTVRGNLFVNTKRPELNSIIDDPAEANASVEKLRRYDVGTVYPGHGRLFRMSKLIP